MFYLTNVGSFSVDTWPESKSISLNYFDYSKESLNQCKVAEEKLCDLFGWENCTSTIALKRGLLSSFLTNDALDHTDILRNVKFLHREKTEFQELRVYDTLAMGRILVLGGEVQISSLSLDDDNYTLDITRLVVNKEKTYEHVLIVGGGDLLVAAHLIEHYPNVKKVTLCELDKRVPEVTKKYFTVGEIVKKAAMENRLVEVYESGAEFVNKLALTGESTIDAVIIDCTDFELNEDLIAAELYTPSFYRNIYKLLKPGAGFSQQITGIWFKEAFSKRAMEGGFKKYEVFQCDTPEYGCDLPLAFCNKEDK